MEEMVVLNILEKEFPNPLQDSKHEIIRTSPWRAIKILGAFRQRLGTPRRGHSHARVLVRFGVKNDLPWCWQAVAAP